MKPNPIHRLPAPLEAAVQRLKMAAREAAERSIEGLGLAALASSNAFQRDGLLGAQFELNRKSAVFALSFNDALDERVLREVGPRGAPVAPAGLGGDNAPRLPASAPPTDWASLSLVEDKEVEAQISAERFGMEISSACEWELRELEGYVSSLLSDAGGERNRNPLRPDFVGHAMLRGIEAVTDRPETRKVLTTELGRSLTALLRHTYAEIVADLRDAGVQPLGLSVRNRGGRGLRLEGGPGAELEGNSVQSSYSSIGRLDERGTGRSTGYGSGPGDGSQRGSGGFDVSTRPAAYSGRGGMHSRRGTQLGQVDPALMTIIRRLAFSEVGTGDATAASHVGGYGDEAGASLPLPPNLIRAHRDELRGASRGALDHVVIDVIGFMFDQILADSKVPPQMARQIARLQLPVLRAALGDPGFFSSRRHPVRRFINRMASLGAAFDDFGEEGAIAFLAKVKALIHEVVEGDFDQIEVYEQKLAALESFTAQLAAHDTPDHDAAAALLSEKEDQQRLRQLYALRLEGDLKDVSAPPFLRDFLSRVWSQVMLRAAEQGGASGPQAQRLRTVGRDLFVSVQPKATPALRKEFLASLPRLMQDLTEGMNLIVWPEVSRRAFFGQLMPAHAEALKSPGGRQLDINLMARQVEGALQRPLPSRDDLKAAPKLPVLTDAVQTAQFSPEEAQRVGLMPESSVDWSRTVDIDITAEPAPEPGPVLPGLPAAAEPAEPTEGIALAEHVEIGFAYQMHVDGDWKKVRLAHVSPGRSFFIFTHGGRHRKTISLTQRMLARLCETGRLRAFESAYLIERATARARRQLAALAGGASAS